MARWTVVVGVPTVAEGTGTIRTRERFGRYQLQVEWRIPVGIKVKGHAPGNSGTVLAPTSDGDARYELQILNRPRNRTSANGKSSRIYKQIAPLDVRVDRRTAAIRLQA